MYATGRLALWSRGRRVQKLEELTKPEIRHVAIANPSHAPYGLAARQMLEKHGLWGPLQPKIVLAENVRQTLQFAEGGNADVALVAWSLVLGTGGVLLPASDHAPIRQAGGIIKGTKHGADARRFMELLSSQAGRKVLAQFGYTAQ